MLQATTIDKRLIKAFENVAEMRSDVRHMKRKIEMAEFKGEMAAMEGRLHAHINRQTWMTISVIAPLTVASVGLTAYFVKILA